MSHHSLHTVVSWQSIPYQSKKTMSPKQHITSAKDIIPFKQKVLYGSGAFADMTFQYAIFILAMPIFNLELGVNPMYIGMVIAFTRIWDAFTDPMVGSLSDNMRSRFGRRRPFIAIGGILAGIFYAVVWLVPEGMSEMGIAIYFLITAILFYTSYTVFSVPFYAMGYEMSPDHHERTKIMAVRIFANSFNGIIFFPWIYWIIQRSFWETPMQGVRVVGIGTGLLMMILAIIPALTIKEPSRKYVKKQVRVPVLQSVKSTLSNKPFLFLMIAFLIAIFAYNAVASMLIYPITYRVFGGDSEAASAWFGFALMGMHAAVIITSFVGVYLSNKIGKRRATMLLSSFIGIGSLAQLFCFVPGIPWLIPIPQFIMGIGWAGLWILVSSMIADVVDYDEWKTGTRREGMFGAIHFWVFKLGFGLGALLSGFILNSTGFNVDLGNNQPDGTLSQIIMLLSIIPAMGVCVVIYFISRYPISEENAYETRTKLEERRGES